MLPHPVLPGHLADCATLRTDVMALHLWVAALSRRASSQFFDSDYRLKIILKYKQCSSEMPTCVTPRGGELLHYSCREQRFVNLDEDISLFLRDPFIC